MPRDLRQLAIFLASAVITAAAIAAFLWAFGPGPARFHRFDVPEGATLRTIGRSLARNGAIHSATALELVGRLMGEERLVRAGRFTLPPRATPMEVIRLLVSGRMDMNEVTIPEGLTIWETAGILGAAAGVDSARFVEAATDSQVALAFGVDRRTLEGYLFPDTYDIPPGSPAGDVLAMLVSRTRRILGEVAAGEDVRAPFRRRDELLVLASIVEAEARIVEEQPRIAAVYLNRLRIGMRLEADPTVAYALRARRRLYHRDLEVDSPYNTYRALGLPPTAICSPGRGAIQATWLAAGLPAGDELYFVARGDGAHVFSRTFAQHERALREVRGGSARRADILDPEVEGGVRPPGP